MLLPEKGSTEEPSANSLLCTARRSCEGPANGPFGAMTCYVAWPFSGYRCHVAISTSHPKPHFPSVGPANMLSLNPTP